MKCIVIGIVVTCTGHIPKLKPADAAAVMKPHEFVYVAPPPINLDPVVSTNASPTSGPFGEFPKVPRWFFERPRVDYYPPPLLWHPWPIYRAPVVNRPIPRAKIIR